MARKKQEFKPDAQAGFLKKFHLTVQQRLTILKWLLYALVCVLLLVIQDVAMSRFSFFGATTDLAAGAILLITVLIGTENGSLFVLIASVLYVFSGSAPGIYSIATLTFLGVAATLLRQRYWRRGLATTVLTAGLALLTYELVTFLIGIFLGLTYWGRFGVFTLTAAYTTLVMFPLYPLVYTIGQIGGATWKE